MKIMDAVRWLFGPDTTQDESSAEMSAALEAHREAGERLERAVAGSIRQSRRSEARIEDLYRHDIEDIHRLKAGRPQIPAQR